MLLAFLIIFVVLFLWTTMTARKRSQAVPVAQQPAPPVVTSHAPPAASPLPPTKALPERFDTLENRRLRIVFSSQGGTIASVWLKDYRVQLAPEGAHAAGITLLTGAGSADLSYRPMTVRRTADALEYADSIADLRVTRRYQLGDDYALSVEVEMSGPNSGYVLTFPDGIALTEANRPQDLMHNHLLVQSGNIERYGAKQVRNGLQLNRHYQWAGMRTLYFLTALSPQSGALDTVSGALLGDNRIGWAAGVKGTRTQDRFLFYFGPMEYNALRRYQLQAAFDFGRFLVIDLKWIGLPILRFLQLLHTALRNFGLAILIFAVLMKAIFYPLSRIQNRQMKNMALLQPKLDELKKRYKNDAEGLNRETMQLYRLYKVNPFYGCLPLLIQMPIFFALYQVLRFSVDLRQAPFVFWIRDLSLRDPYYILPVLMGVFSILQSLLTSAGQQNKMLMIMMPIMITVIFLNFPSGLQLYWLIFNILSIIESLIAQGGTKWRKKARSLHPAVP